LPLRPEHGSGPSVDAVLDADAHSGIFPDYSLDARCPCQYPFL
jgi:hypothetical protein